MFGGLVLILVCQLAGTFLSAALHLSIPGPVVGMVFFLVYLIWRKPEEHEPEWRAAEGLLKYMPLFFVPTGVGIVVLLPELVAQWMPTSIGLIGSWVVALLVTAGVASATRRSKVEKKHEVR